MEELWVLIGILVILIPLLKCLRYFLLTKWHGVPNSFFTSMGEWAVITGSTDGIGKAYAHELARRGLNILLISRSTEKLQKVANEIEQATGRNVKIIQANFINTDIYQHIEKNLRGLDIGILINNVGIIQESHPCKFLEMNDLDKTVNDMISVNVVAVVKIYYTFRKKGLILNISSGTANFPCPYYCLYSSTKIFIERFSRGCQAEYGSKDIIIQCLMPYGVASQMSKSDPGLMVQSAEQFARESLNCVLLGDRCSGCLMHEILVSWFMATCEQANLKVV
ncbi:17-beta-hydroxysteroid dehydrogenase type 3 [Hypanus sabinus]|uniref:17-beta-hydroxysteroid dehydrogenase type 3 n=1 Tax=Hypanus sabinus TaxID=79690 RepID=UPI0028C50B3F|nr:17-beta-hydroxysteroid dehydrogenase type 3 [Hypanus sabinus]